MSGDTAIARYTRGEEIANSLTHACGIVLRYFAVLHYVLPTASS
jgi:hypothetical protein